jgi:hypothetical protein
MYELRTKDGEVIYKKRFNNIDEALIYFANRKQISEDDLLNIYDVVLVP